MFGKATLRGLMAALILVTVIGGNASGQIQYTLIDMGGLAGRNYSDAYGINNKGQVVGVSSTGRTQTTSDAFLWQGGSGMQDLGTLGGGVYSGARASNSNGQVVGLVDYSSSANANLPFIWIAGSGKRQGGGDNAFLITPTVTPELITIDAAYIVRDEGGYPMLTIEVDGVNVVSCEFAARWYNKDGEEITDDGKQPRDKSGNPLPLFLPTGPAHMVYVYRGGSVLPKGVIDTAAFPFRERLRLQADRLNIGHIVLMKLRVICVHCVNGSTVYRFPPIEFEARLKPDDEKAEKTKAKQ